MRTLFKSERNSNSVKPKLNNVKSGACWENQLFQKVLGLGHLTSIRTLDYIYYQRNHSKQFLQTIIREIIQTILTNYFHRNHSKQFLHTFKSQKSLQTMLPNYFKPFLISIISEIIPNNSYNFLLEKSFQTMLTNYFK